MVRQPRGHHTRRSGARNLLNPTVAAPYSAAVQKPHRLNVTIESVDKLSPKLNQVGSQLGHTNLGTTSIYLQGIDIEEIISTVHARRAPMMSATAGLEL